jgi:hypothetical protein
MYNKGVKKNIVLVIGGVVLLGIVAFFIFGKKSLAPVSTPTPKENTQEANQNQPASLKDIIAKGVAQTCTFNTGPTQGIVTVSGGKVRADFAITIGSVATPGHMIVDGSTSYIWTDGQSTGFKTTFNPAASPSTAGGTPASGGIDADRNLNYTCTPGIASSVDFNLPAGVNFMELGGSPAASASGSASNQCSVCNNLPAAAKTQCLTALHCE